MPDARDLANLIQRLLDTGDANALARAIVDADDFARSFRDEFIDPAKRRLGQMLAAEGTPFITVGDRIVEASWAGAKYEVHDVALVADLRDYARTAPRLLDPETGDVEDEAAVVTRLFCSVFQTNRPRTRAVDAAFGARSIDRYRTRVERGHPYISIRKPSVPQPSDEE